MIGCSSEHICEEWTVTGGYMICTYVPLLRVYYTPIKNDRFCLKFWQSFFAPVLDQSCCLGPTGCTFVFHVQCWTFAVFVALLQVSKFQNTSINDMKSIWKSFYNHDLVSTSINATTADIYMNHTWSNDFRKIHRLNRQFDSDLMKNIWTTMEIWKFHEHCLLIMDLWTSICTSSNMSNPLFWSRWSPKSSGSPTKSGPRMWVLRSALKGKMFEKMTIFPENTMANDSEYTIHVMIIQSFPHFGSNQIINCIATLWWIMMSMVGNPNTWTSQKLSSLKSTAHSTNFNH